MTAITLPFVFLICVWINPLFGLASSKQLPKKLGNAATAEYVLDMDDVVKVLGLKQA
jgi:hypothetical protein